jgi:hypothetical protein
VAAIGKKSVSAIKVERNNRITITESFKIVKLCARAALQHFGVSANSPFALVPDEEPRPSKLVASGQRAAASDAATALRTAVSLTPSAWASLRLLLVRMAIGVPSQRLNLSS